MNAHEVLNDTASVSTSRANPVRQRSLAKNKKTLM